MIEADCIVYKSKNPNKCENSYCSAYSSLFNILKPKTNKRTYKSFEENTGKEEETSCRICDIAHYSSCKKECS